MQRDARQLGTTLPVLELSLFSSLLSLSGHGRTNPSIHHLLLLCASSFVCCFFFCGVSEDDDSLVRLTSAERNISFFSLSDEKARLVDDPTVNGVKQLASRNYSVHVGSAAWSRWIAGTSILLFLMRLAASPIPCSVPCRRNTDWLLGMSIVSLFTRSKKEGTSAKKTKSN